MALLVAVVGVQVLHAQDFGFIAQRRSTANIPGFGGITNLGTVGSFSFSTGRLNSATLDVPLLTYADVAVFGTRIAAIGGSGLIGTPTGTSSLVILTNMGDGTFGFPQVIPLFTTPGTLASDGSTLAVGENGGFVETFTSSFVNSGSLTNVRDVNFILGTGPFLTLSIADVASIQFSRFNDDASTDMAYLNEDGTSEFIVTIIGSGIPGLDGNFSDPISTGILSIGPVPNARPDSLGVFLGNNPDTAAIPTEPDTDDDLFMVTTGSIVEFQTNQVVGTVPFLGNIVPSATATFGDTAIAIGAQTGPSIVVGGTPSAVGGGDFNADGIPDVISTNFTTGSAAVNTSTAGGYATTPVRTIVGAGPTALAVGSFNSDSTPDIVVSFGAGIAGSRAFTGNTNGTFAAARNYAASANAAAFASFTGAAGQDVFLAAASSGPGSGIAFIPSSGQFAIVKVYTATSLSASFNSAGVRDDIVLIEQVTGTVLVLLDVNAGGAAPKVTLLDLNDLFTQFDIIPTSACAFVDNLSQNTGLAVTDIGTPTGNFSFGQIIVLMNDGTGNFSDFLIAARQFVATTGATNIASGDFDNSGNSEQAIGDDLVYIDFNSNFAAVALNDSTNFFLNPNFRETGGFIPVGARLGDVNDDDRLDLVVANQGATVGGGQFNQSLVSVLLGDGAGRLFPTGALLQVPNLALSLVGGNSDFLANGVTRIVDFNNDGFPDFAVASSGGGTGNIGVPGRVGSVTLLLNRPDSPGNFTVSSPISLIDDTPVTPGISPNLDLEGQFGGPGLVSGRFGDQTLLVDTNGDGVPDTGTGLGAGGANYVLAVGDFNADGSPDLNVTGTRLVNFDVDVDGLGDFAPVLNVPGVPTAANFRSSLYLFGNETASTVRVARPLRAVEYTPINPATGTFTGFNPFINGGDTFVATTAGAYFNDPRQIPDTLHVSIIGNIWVDANFTSILNHAPIINLRKADLNSALSAGASPIGVGRKVVVTAGQTATINVAPRSSDLDGDTLRFFLRATPLGEQPPAFAKIVENTGVLTINTATANVPQGNTQDFRIAVEATDAPASLPGSGPGARLPLTGRDYFTLRVLGNSPPTIGAIANQTVEAGKTATVALSITDTPGQTVTASARCDRGNFVSVSGSTLTIAPQAGDVGTATCTVTATDNFGLSASASFAVNVIAANLAPTIAAIPNQTLKAGTVLTINVSATDPNGNAGLRLVLTAAPTFATISDNGNGSGVIRLAPLPNETQGGTVTVQATDPGGLTGQATFQVTVTRNVSILAVTRSKPNLFISGSGYGQSGATVNLNGQDVSSRIVGQSDVSITLKGGKKKLNLRTGPNQVTVTAGGVTSSPFVFNLLATDE
jgi:hypothetical protein